VEFDSVEGPHSHTLFFC